MPLQIRNTKQLIDPSQFKLKTLIVAPPGFGKTTWAAGAPNPAFAACETGHGAGLLPIANKGFDYVIPTTYPELEQVSSGQIFKSQDTIVVDGFSEFCRTIVKDYALTVPRKFGDTQKRAMGVPELDDYNTMGELGRKFLRTLLQLDKHIVVTALYAPYQSPDPKEGKDERIGGPDLPGSLRLGVCAMFDHVFMLKVEPVLITKDGKPFRTVRRVLVTVGSDKFIAKSRSSIDDSQILPPEIVFDPQANTGTFADVHKRIVDFYAAKASK